MKSKDLELAITERTFEGSNTLEELLTQYLENKLEKIINSSYDDDEIGTTSLDNKEVA